MRQKEGALLLQINYTPRGYVQSTNGKEREERSLTGPRKDQERAFPSRRHAAVPPEGIS